MNIKCILSIFITIMIMFFITTVSHAWTINMDFNQGPLGRSVEDKGNSYPVFSDAAGGTVYSDCAGISQDGQCAKMNINKGYDGWGTWGGRLNFNERGVSNPVVGTEVWISVKLFMPEGFDYSAIPWLKFLRLHTTSSGKSNEGYNDLYITTIGEKYYDSVLKKNLLQPPFFFIKEQQDLLKRFGDINLDNPVTGIWETYEVYLKMDYRSVTTGGTSRVRIWKNGKLLAEFNDIQTLNSAISQADSFLIFTYWNGGKPDGSGAVPTKDQFLFIDDLIITTDKPARRDISGNPMIGDVLIVPNSPINLQIN